MLSNALVNIFVFLTGSTSAYVVSPRLDVRAASTVCSSQAATTFPLSCSSATVQNTCCTDSPGGHFLLTQFWDTGATSSGPNTSFTLHGLWPDNCDGTYEQYCDSSRESTAIRSTLQNAGQTDLLNYMNIYWKDYQGDDESFWEHEWNKHGTCISSLQPSCFTTTSNRQDLVTYFQRTVALFKQLPSYDWLVQAGIKPSTTTTYTRAQIENALSAKFGGGININCKGSNLNELWYHYRTRGGVASGNFYPNSPVGPSSTCPSTGIKFLPKYVDTTTPTTTGTSPGSSTAPGSKGFIYPTYSNGQVESNACLISDGTWFKGGSCAGYTLIAASGGYKLQTSKGFCAISSSALTCSSTVSSSSAAVFALDSSSKTLSYNGNKAFSAGAVPSGTTRQTVYAGSGRAIALTLVFSS